VTVLACGSFYQDMLCREDCGASNSHLLQPLLGSHSSLQARAALPAAASSST
jgi:hypothetical protein